MNPSPLQLERYFFSKVEITTHPDGEIGTPNLIGCQIEIVRAPDNLRRFQVSLLVKLTSPPEKKATYTGEVQAIGLFHVLPVWPDDKIDTLVESNGLAVLFGAIRELVYNITSRGPWPAVMLNTFTFIPDKSPTAPAKAELVSK